MTAVSSEALILIKNIAKGVLYRGDLSTDRNVASEFRLDVGRAGEVVGMDMGLENAVNRQAVLADIGHQTICGFCREGP